MKIKKIERSAMFIFVFGLVLSLGVILSGCGKTTEDYVLDNMSEWTKVYYYGEGNGVYVSLSSGTREQTYLLNGKSEDSVDFALLSVNFDSSIGSNLIKATIFIDGESSQEELEVGGVNSAYMVDLEKALTGDEVVVIEYDGQEIALTNLSKDFVIGDEQAIEIASKEIEESIVALKSGKTLNAECYLRVLDKKVNNFEEVFWCFTVVNANNESSSVIISTSDGSILAKS